MSAKYSSSRHHHNINQASGKGRNAVHFSSKTCEWETPQEFFDEWNAEFGPFELDPCATSENAKCPKYYTKADDGLVQPWAPYKVWLNPPYGREIGLWMAKAYEESLRGALVVCLVPARTDTKWWHSYVVHGRVCFIQGRLKFGDSKNAAPFPSAVVVFHPIGTSSIKPSQMAA